MHVGQSISLSLSRAPIGLEIDAFSFLPSWPPRWRCSRRRGRQLWYFLSDGRHVDEAPWGLCLHCSSLTTKQARKEGRKEEGALISTFSRCSAPPSLPLSAASVRFLPSSLDRINQPRIS